MQNSNEDDKIAGIYQKMMNGDNNAINEIQRIQVKQYNSSNKNISQHRNRNSPQLKQQKSSDKNKAKKNQNFRTYLREKVTELRNVKNDSKRQLPKNDKTNQNKQFREPKPFPKVKQRSDVKSQKNTVTGETKDRIDQMIQQKGGSLNKVKTTSNKFQQRIGRNVIKDKQQSQKLSTPPTSKHSIRIRQPMAKKKIQQLLKINEQERRIQTQILNFHNQTKEQIQQIKDKYSLQLKKIQIQNKQEINFGSILDDISKNFQFIDQEQKNVYRINRQIQKINSQLKQRKNKTSKLQAKIQSSPLLPYLNNQFQDIFQQRQSQQDQDVFQLPTKQHRQVDRSTSYQNMMGQKRKKIWGLKQRTNYQPTKLQNSTVYQKQLKKQANKIVQNYQKMKQQQYLQNKVVVNSRLKQFLLDQN